MLMTALSLTPTGIYPQRAIMTQGCLVKTEQAAQTAESIQNKELFKKATVQLWRENVLFCFKE